LWISIKKGKKALQKIYYLYYIDSKNRRDYE
jgi:hypothetical protein